MKKSCVKSKLWKSRIELLVLLIVTLSPTLVVASSVECFVDVSDGTADGKSRITFKLSESEAGTRRHFQVLSGAYRCTLYFSDREHGTMLSCELSKDLGRTFSQSDRSAIKENSQFNTLTFRDSSNQIVDLTSNCDSQK